MLEAMSTAAVSDDVLEGDPTCGELEQRIAELTGQAAALFVPSGTMANQIAIRLHCSRDSEVLCEANCHIYNYEQAGYAQLSGVALRPLQGQTGKLSTEQLDAAIRPDDPHFPSTGMLALENTHNKAGGIVQSPAEIQPLLDWARQRDLPTHLDGARLFNAAVALDIPASEIASGFDSVSVCFSKGLGAPVGSALCGSSEFIHQARRVRKLLGGGMRQVGFLAAAALYALEHNVARLAEDHSRASQLADAIKQSKSLKLCSRPETNIVLFRSTRPNQSVDEMCRRLGQNGVGALPMGPDVIRLVTHLGVTPEEINHACDVLSTE